MKRVALFLMAVCALLATAALARFAVARAAAAGQSYASPTPTLSFTFQTIDFPNALRTLGAGINEKGDVTGRYSDVNNVVHGFLLHSGTFTTQI